MHGGKGQRTRNLSPLINVILRFWIIVSQNLQGHVGRIIIGGHRGIRAGSKTSLDGAGVGQIGVNVVVDRKPCCCAVILGESLHFAFAGGIDRHHADMDRP